MKVLNAKLREKFIEALKAVLPIVAIVLILGFTIAPVTPSVLLCFLVGTVMVMAGMMFYIRCGDVNDADGRKSRCMYDKK